MRLGIIGGGRAASALALAWTAAGESLSGIYTRATSSLPHGLQQFTVPLDTLTANSDLLAIAVSDPAIATVWRSIESSTPGGTHVFHLSGAMTSAVLSPHTLRFSLHPLRSLPPAGTMVDFAGTLFTFEGSAGSAAVAGSLVKILKGTFAEIEGSQKLTYHSAAVFASNFTALLLEEAEGLLIQAGLKDRRLLAEAITALAHSSIENWSLQNGASRFTGPVARGDIELVRREELALRESSPAVADLYIRLSRDLAARLLAAQPDRSDLVALARELQSPPVP